MRSPFRLVRFFCFFHPFILRLFEIPFALPSVHCLGADCRLQCPGPASSTHPEPEHKIVQRHPRSWAPHPSPTARRQPLVFGLAAGGGTHLPADSSNQITKFKKSGCALKSSFAFPLVSPPSPRTTNQPTNHPLHCPRLSSEQNRPKILSNQRLRPSTPAQPLQSNWDFLSNSI